MPWQDAAQVTCPMCLPFQISLTQGKKKISLLQEAQRLEECEGRDAGGLAASWRWAWGYHGKGKVQESGEFLSHLRA